MAKNLVRQIKMQLGGGKANPASVGTSLGPSGINMMDFCKKFNDKTSSDPDGLFPVVIDVYSDKSFSFIIKVTPVSFLIRKTLGLEKGSNEANKTKVGTLSQVQLEEIAVKKMPDLNANDMESAKKMIAGTARSMGVLIES